MTQIITLYGHGVTHLHYNLVQIHSDLILLFIENYTISYFIICFNLFSLIIFCLSFYILNIDFFFKKKKKSSLLSKVLYVLTLFC